MNDSEQLRTQNLVLQNENNRIQAELDRAVEAMKKIWAKLPEESGETEEQEGVRSVNISILWQI